MQDQLTGGNTNLQQQQGNLQQNTPNLQQSGTPTATSNVSGLLSENAQTSQLQVTTVSNSNSTIQPDSTLASAGSNSWLLPLLIIVTLIVAYIAYTIMRRMNQIVVMEPAEELPASEPVQAPKPKKTTKSKKKSQKHRKSGRR